MRTTAAFGEDKFTSSLTQKLKVIPRKHLDLIPGLTLCAGSVFPDLGLKEPDQQGWCPCFW